MKSAGIKIFSFFLLALASVPFSAHALPDVLAPQSAGATSIAGVNWGTVTVTDYSINIIGAYLIPIAPAGPKTFKLEYGYGEYGQAPAQYVRLDNDQTYIEQPPEYTFSVSLPNLNPNRSYYFNIREVVGNEVRDLGVYGYAMTNIIHSNYIYNQPESDSVRIYGHLVLENGAALVNTPINVFLFEGASETLVMGTVPVTTAGVGGPNGNGFFEAEFESLSPSSMYTVVIEAQDGTQIYPSFTITTEAEGSSGNGGGGGGGGGGNGGGNSGPAAEPPYNGLVSCGNTNQNGDLDECDFNDLIVTINRVINFLIFYIAFPIVALVAAWAGIKLLTSGGDPGAKKSAKEMMKKVIIGLVIALLCWIIVKLILMTLGYQGPLLEVLNLNSNYEPLQ